MVTILSVFLLAGMVKGIIGLGLPTIAMGLLALSMPPVSAAALLLIPSLVTNLWQLLAGPAFLLLARRLGSFLVAILIGTMWGGLPTLTEEAIWAPIVLGVMLVLYGLWGLIARRLPAPDRHEVWLSPLMGYVTGAITAATGVFVIPAVPYLQCLALKKDDLVQALGLAFTVSTLGLAFSLVQGGGLPALNLSLSLLALIPALLGMMLGQRLRKHIGETLFRRCFFLGLIALGGTMVLGIGG